MAASTTIIGRRGALRAMAGASALAVLPGGAAARLIVNGPHPDAELLALGPAIDEADRQQHLAIDAEAKVDEAFFEKKRALGPAPIAPEEPEWTAAIEAARKANEATEARQSTGAYAEAMAAWKAQYEALDAEHTKEAESLTGPANDKIAELREEILSWQPETLDGLIFKARYAAAHYEYEYDLDVMISIVDDLLAMSAEAADV